MKKETEAGIIFGSMILWNVENWGEVDMKEGKGRKEREGKERLPWSHDDDDDVMLVTIEK